MKKKWFLFVFLTALVIDGTVLASPLEENDIVIVDNDYSNNQKTELKRIFKGYLSLYKDFLKEKEKDIHSKEAKRIIDNNKRFIEKGRIKAFSKINNGVRGKVLYIYKDYANEIANIKLSKDKKLYVLSTFIDKRILKNKRIEITKYMENIDIRQIGVSGKKKEIT